MARVPRANGRAAALPVTVTRATLLVDGSDAKFRQLVADLFTVSVRMQAVRDGFARRLGVTGPQYNILMAVAHLAEGNAATVSAVAEQLHVSGAFVTAETGKLAAAGWLEKSTHPVDRRSVVLNLTRSGARKVDAIIERVRAVNDRFFGSLAAREFAQLSGSIANLVAQSDAAVALATHGEPARKRAARRAAVSASAEVV
ncbi:MAG: MarR family winged helix-turn-helix transcriptional regulator [Alphaproteobacteria bacterium]